MCDQVDEVFPIFQNPHDFSRKDSLFDFNDLLSPNSGKPTNTMELTTMDEFGDDNSTMDSSNLCSQTFETPVKSIRKRSLSDDNLTLNFDGVYSRIEKFFDQEGLDIISHSPILTCKTLKPCMKMTELPQMSQSLKLKETNKRAIPTFHSPPLEKACLPSFMVKRTSSFGAVNDVKKKLIAETKFGFSRFSLDDKDREVIQNMQENKSDENRQ